MNNYPIPLRDGKKSYKYIEGDINVCSIQIML